jgi:hypothetical protein
MIVPGGSKLPGGRHAYYFSKAVEVVFALKASKLWDLGSLGERLIITFLRPPARAAEEVGIFCPVGCPLK